MSAPEQFIAGTALGLYVDFFNADAELEDPTDIALEMRLPDESVVDLTDDIQRLTIGQYLCVYTPTLNGLHQYRWAGTGAVVAADEGNFLAQTSFPDEED